MRESFWSFSVQLESRHAAKPRCGPNNEHPEADFSSTLEGPVWVSHIKQVALVFVLDEVRLNRVFVWIE